jgi:hypothetical protein
LIIDIQELQSGFLFLDQGVAADSLAKSYFVTLVIGLALGNFHSSLISTNLPDSFFLNENQFKVSGPSFGNMEKHTI